MKKSNFVKAAVILLPFLAAGAAFLLSPLILEAADLLPPCKIHLYTGLSFPGCGNTRAVIALVNLDIIASFRYNPIPVLSLIIAGLGYGELALYVFDRPKKLLPRKFSFWLVFIVLFLVYCVVRNFIPWLSLA